MKGKIIYQPDGKAFEYCHWAANFYNGCSNGCDYCFNNKGLNAATVGGLNVRLKKTLIDEQTAFELFKADLDKFGQQIIDEDSAIHFNFVSDPCLPETLPLNWACIEYALSKGVPCQVLTKRADWLGESCVQKALCIGKGGLLKVGFTLTGHDEREPGASPTIQRIQAMKILHDTGICTWASMEPIISPDRSYQIIDATKEFCLHYKIGIMSGARSYGVQEIRELVSKVQALGLPSVYWKDSLVKFIQ